MKNILVVGSLNFDYLIQVDETPKIGETIFGKEVKFMPGGKGANQAYAASKLGAKVAMIGAVGEDAYGEILKNNLKSVGVDISGIETLSNIETGNAFVTVNKEGDNNIVVIPGANALVNKEIIDKHLSLIESSTYVVVQLEIPIDTVIYLIKTAKKIGKTIILDPAPANKKLPKEIFPFIDIIKPNETELEELTGLKSETDEEVIRAGRKLNEKGIKTVIVTRGGKGSFVITKEDAIKIDAIKANVVDTTGAGDSFIGAMVCALSKGENLYKAVNFATKASSITVKRKGAQNSMPDEMEIKELD